MDNELINDCEESFTTANDLRYRVQNSDNATCEAILESIISQLHSEASLRKGYSGRNMYGRLCFGIVADNPSEVIEAAAIAGIRNAKMDSMGYKTIVYWPNLNCEDVEDS